MLFEVSHHVNQGVTHCSRCRERALMPAIRDQRPSPKQEAIQAASQPRREAAHARDQRSSFVRLDDQMKMIALHRKLNDSKLLTT
jgi:hypothetical protein